MPFKDFPKFCRMYLFLGVHLFSILMLWTIKCHNEIMTLVSILCSYMEKEIRINCWICKNFNWIWNEIRLIDKISLVDSNLIDLHGNNKFIKGNVVTHIENYNFENYLRNMSLKLKRVRVEICILKLLLSFIVIAISDKTLKISSRFIII